VNGKRLSRILEAELAVARLTAPRADDTAAGIDDAALLAEVRRLLADPPPPSPLDPDIAAMSDAEAVEEWRRL